MTLTSGPPACLDDDTAYYGNNIGDPRKSIDSSDCQESCERRNRCEFWSFDKAWGECWLKTSKAGEPATTKRYGPVYPGNNQNYVSGSKYCIHVSRSIWLRKGRLSNNMGSLETHFCSDNFGMKCRCQDLRGICVSCWTATSFNKVDIWILDLYYIYDCNQNAKDVYILYI